MAIGISIFMFVIWVLVTSFKRITKYKNSLIVLDKYHVQIELFLRNYRVERVYFRLFDSIHSFLGGRKYID